MAIIAFSLNNRLNNTIQDAVVPEGELFPPVPDNGFSA